MGAYLKYIIPFVLIAAGLAIFQNCGQRLQANGDPYENDSIRHDDPFTEIPGGNDPDQGGGEAAPPLDGQAAVRFQGEIACLPAAQSPFHVISLGKQDGFDSVFIQVTAGNFKVYRWVVQDSLVHLNDTLGKVKIATLQYDDANKLMRVNFTYGGENKEEILVCE